MIKDSRFFSSITLQLSVTSLLFLFLFLIHIPAYCQGEIKELGYFHNIINVHELDSSKLAIVSNGGTHHVTIYSLDSNEVLSSFIRNGRGPGEIMRAEASMIEKSDNGTLMHVIDFAGKFITYNLHTKQLVKEDQTRFIQISNLSKFENHFILSKRIVLPAGQLSTINHVDVGYVANEKTLQVTDTLRLSISELDVYDTANLNRLNEGTYIRLDSYLEPLSNNSYLLGIRGNSTAFYLSNGKLSDKVKLNTSNTGTIEVVRNEAFGYGLKIPGILNNVYHVNRDESTIQFSSDQQVSGNDPQVISISHAQDGLSVDYKSLESVDHLSYRLMIYKLNEGYVMHDRAVNRSSSLYLIQ